MLQILFFLVAFSGLGFTFGQDEPGAIWIPSPHKFNGRGGQSVRWLIIHGTAGGSSAEGIGYWFQNPASQASTHYVVGRDGKIVQCVNERDGAWGNGVIESGADSWWSSSINPNLQTISIENVKPSTDNSDIISEEQKQSIFYLIRNIIRRYPAIRIGWANSNGGITGHFSMSPQSRARCPGPFPFDELFAYLNNVSPPPVCTGVVRADIGLNVRVLPFTWANVQGTLNNGQTVTIHRRVTGDNIEGNNGWFHLWNGYAAAAYIQLNEPRPSWCY